MKDYPPISEPEDFSAKEVLLFFGLASYNAQVLEKEMVNLALTVSLQYGTPDDLAQFDRLFGDLDSRTMGQLINRVRNFIEISDELETRLKHALAKRNYLAHQFFADNAENSLCETGRRKMIDQLRLLSQEFIDADKELTALTRALSRTIGVTEEMIQREFGKMLARARERTDYPDTI